MIKPTFNKRLILNLDALHNRIFVKKKASMIIIDGLQGEGKTTLGVQCADYFQQQEIDLNEPCQLAIGGKDFKIKFDICIERKLIVIIYDEAGDFDKYNMFSEFNKILAQFFRMFRTYKILIIVILPFFNDLDPRLFTNGVPRLLLHCEGKTETRGHFKAYGLWRIQHLRLKLKNLSNKIIPQEVFKYVRPNFQGEFYDISPERSKLLDKISTEGKSEIRLQTKIKDSELMTIRQIAKELERSILWVKQKIALKKIEPSLTHKRSHYFEKDIIQTLAGEKKK